MQPRGLMIYECISRHGRVIHSMIYQVCDLDKKVSPKETARLGFVPMRTEAECGTMLVLNSYFARISAGAGMCAG